MFSPRVPKNLEQNRIARAVRRAQADATKLVDLTVTNPTRVGIAYPEDLLAALAKRDGLIYAPEAFGLAEARHAVAADYDRRGVPIDPDRIVLTASTSEAYSLLFKLMCAASGDAVLVPTPSYPLFDHLTALDGVAAIPYRLEYHGVWRVAFEDLDRDWTRHVRAVLAVSPNNPTGSLLGSDEIRDLSSRCAERTAALIIDEVFADYPLDSRQPIHEFAAGSALTFRLGGLSKSAGLPQLKLGWIAVGGPEPIVRDALARLEIICDAYLSVATPVQVAAPALIAAGAQIRGQILDRVRSNYRALADLVARRQSIDLLNADAGWSAVLRVPATRSEEELVLDLITRDGVLVHPGFFFDFPHESFLVVSLLPEPETFAEGVRKVLERADG